MDFAPGRLWSLWDIMKAFNAALLGHAFSSLSAYSQQETAGGMNAGRVSQTRLEDISLSLAAAKVMAVVLELDETRDAVERLARDMKSTVEPMTHVTMHYALQSILDLMKNELDKRKVFALDPEKSKYYQWGQMIGEIQKKKDLIDHWKRSKALKEEAIRYYSRAILEVDSFNEIFRKHISHARGEVYESDVAISCWGHVYRFMDMLSERMSETDGTPNVWNSPKKVKPKKAKPSVFD
jgi:hypothetical protein